MHSPTDNTLEDCIKDAQTSHHCILKIRAEKDIPVCHIKEKSTSTGLSHMSHTKQSSQQEMLQQAQVDTQNILVIATAAIQ